MDRPKAGLCGFVLLAVVLGIIWISPVSAAAGVLETFENSNISLWAVGRDTNINNGISRSSAQFAGGSYSALLHTAGANQKAALYATYNEPATAHQWNERPGTWHWQRASVYLPSATVGRLSGNEYLTLAGMYASANASTYGWYLRVGANGALSVVGTPQNASATVFNVYGTFPTNRWVEVEIGLHSQNGPGVKRAFAFLIDGQFYGWYRQGRLTEETYSRAAFGILSTNSPDSLDVYVDQWRSATTFRFPDGPDNRSTANLQEQDFRTVSGVQVQYDWSTWTNNLTLHPTYGLYSANNRLQAGRNLDRMPSVANGWGEIEIDWPNGTPPNCINNYCSAMIGFRKEINREENLEIIPHANANGIFYLWFEAWTGGPVKLAEWRIPDAQAAPGRNMPEPGDIIRARWEQVSSTQLRVRASYYDASAGTWFRDVIDHTFNATRIVDPGDASHVVNYLDGYHDAASITIDSPYYSIRRFRVGTLATYAEPAVTTPTPLTPPDQSTSAITRPTFQWTSVPGAAAYELLLDTVNPPAATVYRGASTSYEPPAPLLNGHTYSWQVRALDGSNVPSAWSSVQTVQISGESTTDASPMSNVFKTTRQPTLSWSAVTWATGYRVEVSRQPSFEELVDERELLDASVLSVMVGVALADGVYFWRVRARRPDGTWGNWSATGSFVIDVTPS
ncbi:MAG: hypothetical protein HZC41_12585 [Chloroflexi bacterium]|nr:hypothetical protein [Chloroflexota bacterium]